MTPKDRMSLLAYLRRLGLAETRPPGLDFLRQLIEAHLLAVPFENLDVVEGRKIFIQEAVVFDKVVLGGRGGYCYELNNLFRWLLIRLGFEVDRVGGRVYNAKKGLFGPELDHMALLVRLEGRVFLVDVGFGTPFRRPLAWPEDEVEEPGGRYRLRALGGDSDERVVEIKDPAGWRIMYAFTETPRSVEDFLEMNVYQQTSPQALFSRGVFCSIATPRGWMNLFDHTLTVVENGRREQVELATTDLRDRFLRAHFRLPASAGQTPEAEPASLPRSRP